MTYFACYFNHNCGVLVSHKSEGPAHETHGHKTTSGHGEEEHKERKGICFVCRGSNVLVDLHAVVYMWFSKSDNNNIRCRNYRANSE